MTVLTPLQAALAELHRRNPEHTNHKVIGCDPGEGDDAVVFKCDCGEGLEMSATSLRRMGILKSDIAA